MNDTPANGSITAADAVLQTACDMTKVYGAAITDDPRRCEALLRDLCGHHKREINVLVTALKERIAVDLNEPAQGLPYGTIRSRLVQRLYDTQAVEMKFGSWAVDVWALALGKITDAEYETLTARPFVENEEMPIIAPPPAPRHPIEELRGAIRVALEDDVVTLDEQRHLKELSRRLKVPSQIANQVLGEVVAERKKTKK